MPSEKIVRHYDVQDFEEAIEQATTSDDERERERLYRHAIDLYKAPFLETLNMTWVEQRRAYLRQLYAQALVGIARICQKREDIDEALGFYARAVKEMPEREDVHRELMRIYIGKGMKQDAKKQYDVLKKTLKELYGITPSRATQDIYDSI
jgi:two-component SAPR family response regulator